MSYKYLIIEFRYPDVQFDEIRYNLELTFDEFEIFDFVINSLKNRNNGLIELEHELLFLASDRHWDDIDKEKSEFLLNEIRRVGNNLYRLFTTLGLYRDNKLIYSFKDRPSSEMLILQDLDTLTIDDIKEKIYM